MEWLRSLRSRASFGLAAVSRYALFYAKSPSVDFSQTPLLAELAVYSPATLYCSPNLADLVRSQSIGKPIDCYNIAQDAILARIPIATPDRRVAGRVRFVICIVLVSEACSMYHKHALGMVVVGAPLVRPVQARNACVEPIATHSPTVPFRFVCCCTQETRRAQRRAGVVTGVHSGSDGTGTPMLFTYNSAPVLENASSNPSSRIHTSREPTSSVETGPTSTRFNFRNDLCIGF